METSRQFSYEINNTVPMNRNEPHPLRCLGCQVCNNPSMMGTGRVMQRKVGRYAFSYYVLNIVSFSGPNVRSLGDQVDRVCG